MFNIIQQKIMHCDASNQFLPLQGFPMPWWSTMASCTSHAQQMSWADPERRQVWRHWVSRRVFEGWKLDHHKIKSAQWQFIFSHGIFCWNRWTQFKNLSVWLFTFLFPTSNYSVIQYSKRLLHAGINHSYLRIAFATHWFVRWTFTN